MDDFWAAPMKKEGAPINYDSATPKKEVDTTYVERRVPRHLEEECHRLIDSWLAAKNYDVRNL